MLSPFAQQYKEELTSLKNSDRQSISFLKNLAAENKHEHLDIIVAVQEWLYQVRKTPCTRNSDLVPGGESSTSPQSDDLFLQCPEAAQLPLLYLVDCIMKTVGEPYVSHFCPPLPSVSQPLFSCLGMLLIYPACMLADVPLCLGFFKSRDPKAAAQTGRDMDANLASSHSDCRL